MQTGCGCVPGGGADDARNRGSGAATPESEPSPPPTDPGGHENIVAKADVKYLHTLYLIQTSPAATVDARNSGSFSGTFDLVVRANSGFELDRHSLNEYFDGKDLRFDGPVTLGVGNYTDNDFLCDVPIGFPADDGSGEYKYVIFSVGVNGLITPLPTEGYKEDGFIYTKPAGNSIEFTGAIGRGQGVPPGILVGVAKEGGGFEPAKYVWDGETFEFQRESPFIISQAELDAYDERYLITLVQTGYEKPLASFDDPGFTIYESLHRGYLTSLSRTAAEA